MNLKKSVIAREVLDKIGEEAFPGVSEPCPVCDGGGVLCQSVHGVKEFCHTCRGCGRIFREMTPREEHYWIIRLIRRREQE